MNSTYWLEDAFKRMEFGRVPNRLQLRTLFSVSPIPASVQLILLFGSAARDEAASDIDIVVVVEQDSGPLHKYERLQLNGVKLDLNVVDAEWLARAILDLEQSYWLSESYAVFFRSEVWLTRWMAAANNYWRTSAVKRRRTQFSDLIASYASISRCAFRLGLKRVSQFAAHEAARAYVCDLMDQDGAPTHSHRLVAKSLQQGGLKKVPQHIRGHLEKCLYRGVNSIEKYLELRKRLSTFKRATSTLKLLGLHSVHSHSMAAAVLSELLPSRGTEFEALLSCSDLEEVLPSECPSQLTEALAYTVQPVSTKSQRMQELSVPVLGNVDGARWVERTQDRVKIIVNTGGCKTPTCTFCSLPQYSRQLLRREPAEVVRSALALHEVSGLSLYNDGNFFNDAEISLHDRSLICGAILERQVRSLTIESAPRFITERKVREVQAWSGVAELVVAMGLQTTGSCTAARVLGRPDVDSIFSFAIDEVHAAGAAVRLYLLHGYDQNFAFWDQRLVESVEWAAVRGVERISICPYVDATGALLDQAHVAHLEALVRTLPVGAGMTLELVGRGLTSCGAGAHGGR